MLDGLVGFCFWPLPVVSSKGAYKWDVRFRHSSTVFYRRLRRHVSMHEWCDVQR